MDEEKGRRRDGMGERSRIEKEGEGGGLWSVG
jgi:hypothetical protein